MAEVKTQSNPPTPPQAERRKHVRLKSNRVISGLFNLKGSEDQWPVEVWDISAGGFSFLTSQRIVIGQVVEVELESPAGNPETRFTACVVHAVHLPHGEFILGCAFSQEVSWERIQSLL